MSERPTQAEIDEASNGCSHASSIWSGDMKHGTCKTCGAVWNVLQQWHYEANFTRAQEVEEQEVLNHIEALQLAAIKTDSNLARCYIDLSKLRDKNAATIAHLKEENETLNGALDAKITICGDERIASLKAELTEVRAREAMLVETLTSIRNEYLSKGYLLGSNAVDKILSASSTEVAKWTAEIRAKELEDAIDICQDQQGNEENDDFAQGYEAGCKECEEGIKHLANELRASTSQPTIKEE